MSTTSTRRPLDEALADARDLARLIGPSCWTRISLAGSVRRKKPEVGDLEYVVIHATATEAAATLFGEPKIYDRLNRRLDELVAAEAIAKHLYLSRTGERSTRWGEIYRGVDYRGYLHEFFGADERNFGAILTIRTGPPEFSTRVVTALKRGEILRQQDGYLVDARTLEIVPAPDERTYFSLAGIPWREPEERE